MSTVKKSIRLYAWKPNYQTFKIVQGEINSRKFNIELFEDTTPIDLTGCSVMFYAEKPDDTVVYVRCNIINGSNGIIDVTLTEQMALVSGTVPCWIQVVGTSGTDLRFEGMTIEVEQCGLTRSVESSDDMRAFLQQIARLEELATEIKNARMGQATLVGKEQAQDENLEKAKVELNGTIEQAEQTLQSAIDVLKSRVDSITHLSEGSTTGDAELMDARVGHDGTVYGSAGEAIRQQVGKVYNDITELKNVNSDMSSLWSFRELLDKAVFTEDVTELFENLDKALYKGMCRFKYNLSNISVDNQPTAMKEGESVTIKLSADTGYRIASVCVTMGGVDVTDTVYSDGTIVISSLTGDVVITALSAEKDLTMLDYIELSDGAYFDTGITANMEYKYLIGVKTPDITGQQYIWGTRGRNNTNLDNSDYYDDVMSIDSTLSAQRNVKGSRHYFKMYDSTSINGINGSDNKSNIVPWYLYTKWDASCFEAYADEKMINPLGASEFLNGSMSSNHFPYALNYNEYGSEITPFDSTKHAPSNVYIGKVNNTVGTLGNGYATPVNGIKYYVYKVWNENDELLMYLKPAMKRTKVGMYDVISSTFFESAEGTVTAGNEVSA